MVAAVEMATEGTGLGTDRGPQVKNIVTTPTTRSAMKSKINIGRQFEVEVAAAIGYSNILRGGAVVRGTGEEGLVGYAIKARPLVDDGAEFL